MLDDILVSAALQSPWQVEYTHPTHLWSSGTLWVYLGTETGLIRLFPGATLPYTYGAIDGLSYQPLPPYIV